MRCDVNLIIMALEAHKEQLRAIFGGKNPTPARGRVTRDEWRAFRTKWNQGYKPKGRRDVARPPKGAASV